MRKTIGILSTKDSANRFTPNLLDMGEIKNFPFEGTVDIAVIHKNAQEVATALRAARAFGILTIMCFEKPDELGLIADAYCLESDLPQTINWLLNRKAPNKLATVVTVIGGFKLKHKIGENFEIRENLFIGREPTCDIQSGGLARVHAQISWEEDGLILTDIGGNTILGGKQIERELLSNGDQIFIGGNLCLEITNIGNPPDSFSDHPDQV